MRYKPDKARDSNRLKATLFFLVLFGFTLFSMLFFLRPNYSEVEKRPLAAFPKFSASALASGVYFDDITEWFSDTFPLKDSFVSLNARVKSMYGYGAQIYGKIEQGDDIPTTPYKGKDTE